MRRCAAAILVEADNGLTAAARELFADLYQVQALKHAVDAYDAKIEQMFEANPVPLASREGCMYDLTPGSPTRLSRVLRFPWFIERERP